MPEVPLSIRRIEAGSGFETGLSIALAAIVIDRIARGAASGTIAFPKESGLGEISFVRAGLLRWQDGVREAPSTRNPFPPDFPPGCVGRRGAKNPKWQNPIGVEGFGGAFVDIPHWLCHVYELVEAGISHPIAFIIFR